MELHPSETLMDGEPLEAKLSETFQEKSGRKVAGPYYA
jgi:hypothetical protein